MVMQRSSEQRRAGILACPSPSEAAETTESSPPPYPEFPEIASREIFYTFPTIGAYYQYINKGAEPLGLTLEELLIKLNPQLEPIKNQLLPMIFEYCQTHYGTEMTEAVKSFLVGNFSSNSVRELRSRSEESLRSQVLSIFNDVLRGCFELTVSKIADFEEFNNNEAKNRSGGLFSLNAHFYSLHEIGHRLSLAIDRPATKDFKEVTAKIFDLLLQQSAPDKHNSFWTTFHELNNKLMDCLFVSLALEEVRATICALRDLHPQSHQLIIAGVYPKNRDDGESQIFHKLRALMGDRWEIMWYWTILMELLYPENPLTVMEGLTNVLNEDEVAATTWSEDEWWYLMSEYQDMCDIDKVMSFIKEVYEDPQKWSEILWPNTVLSYVGDRMLIVCPDTMRHKLFLESMRQQLAVLNLHPEHIPSLSCPFKAERNACCGFGSNLQGIWAGIPKEYQDRLNPPAIDCLKHN
jgi:hypothetical protein